MMVGQVATMSNKSYLVYIVFDIDTQILVNVEHYNVAVSFQTRPAAMLIVWEIEYRYCA